MCYSIAQTLGPRELEGYFSAHFENAELYTPFYHASAFDHPLIPVIADKDIGTISLFRWGLIPSWIKDPQKADAVSRGTINARSETVFSKPAFRDAIRQRRCLVLVSGFFEWHELNGRKYPYYIWLKDRPAFALAGIWDRWRYNRTGETRYTFSILTTAANHLLSRIHNTGKRMPVILSKEQELLWVTRSLSSSVVNDLLRPYDDSAMCAQQVTGTLGHSVTTKSGGDNARASMPGTST